jgi:hypothetical protein
MRKCGDCGYLLFGDGETCNHCGSAVPMVESQLRAPVGAGRAANENAAPVVPPRASWPPAPPAPVTRGPSFSAPSPVVPGPDAQPVGEIWRPVTVVPPPPTARTFPAALVLALVGLVVIGALGFTFVRSRNALPAGTSDFVAGNGVSFTAPDRSYTAQFPAEPTITHTEVPMGNTTTRLSLASVETKSYEIGSTSLDIGVAIPKGSAEQVLEQALASGVSRVDGDVVSKKQITRAGLQAIDAKFKAPDGYSAHVLVMVKGSRIYVLYVHAKSGTDRLFDAFDKSFVPTGL